MREPRALWLLLIAISAAYALFASVVSVGYTAIYGLSRWTLRPDTTAIFPYLVLMNLAMWTGYALWTPAIFWLGRRFRFDRRGWKSAAAVHVPASLLITATHLTMVALLRFYLQGLRGLTSLQTGLLMIPGGLAMGLSGPRVGRLFDRFGSRPLVLPGSLAVVAALATLTQISQSTSFWVILAAHVTFMAGMATIFTPVFTLSLGAVPEHLYSHASSLLGSTQQVAGAIGTAMSVTILSSHTASLLRSGATAEHAAIGGMQWAFGASAVVSIGIIALALMLPARAPEGATSHH